jgi:hypothetical protein
VKEILSMTVPKSNSSSNQPVKTFSDVHEPYYSTTRIISIIGIAVGIFVLIALSLYILVRCKQ